MSLQREWSFIYCVRVVPGGRLLGAQPPFTRREPALRGRSRCAGGVGPRAAEPMFTCGGFPQSSQQTSVTADLRPHAARRVLTFTPSLKRRTLLPGQANPAPLFHEH